MNSKFPIDNISIFVILGRIIIMLIASNTLKKLFLKQGPKYFFARFDDTKIPEREINIRKYKTHFNTLYF